MNLPCILALALFLGVIDTHGGEDSKERLSQEVDAPFGKAYVSVSQRQDGQRLLFYVVIAKRSDTPAILAEDVNSMVLDQNGKPIASKPLFRERGPLIEAGGGGGASANKVYQLTLTEGQKPSSATVTWLGHRLEFKTIEVWR
jgi:hypothetical protein